MIARFFKLVAFVVVAADALASGGRSQAIDIIDASDASGLFLLGSGHAAGAAFLDIIFVEARGQGGDVAEGEGGFAWSGDAVVGRGVTAAGEA